LLVKDKNILVQNMHRIVQAPAYLLLLLKKVIDLDLKCVQLINPRVVTEEKNSPTVALACRKRRLKWVLPRLGVGAQG
jgi:hypothetical protein